MVGYVLPDPKEGSQYGRKTRVSSARRGLWEILVVEEQPQDMRGSRDQAGRRRSSRQQGRHEGNFVLHPRRVGRVQAGSQGGRVRLVAPELFITQRASRTSLARF